MLSTDHYIDLKQGEFKGTSPDNLLAAFNALELSEKDHLVVHFHGGLVSRTSGLQSAEGLKVAYERAGAYPFFFIWNADLISVVSGDFAEIMGEDIFRALARQTLRLVSGLWLPRDGRAGPVQFPPLSTVPDNLEEMASYAAQVEASPAALPENLSASTRQAVAFEFETDRSIRRELDGILVALIPAEELAATRSAGEGNVSPKRTRMPPEVLDELGIKMEDGRGRGVISMVKLAMHGALILARVVRRKYQKRDHGLMVTIVEEVLREFYVAGIGSKVWTAMKDDTRKAFDGNPAKHGGTAFLQGLQQWLAGAPQRRVTLVGHSTGAVYIIYFLLNAAKLAAMRPVRVALLAPACTFAFTQENLPLLKQWVNRVRLFGLSDPVERGYFEVPVLYGASLLYMVSGLFEEKHGDTPLVGMQRYHTGAAPYVGAEYADVTGWLKGFTTWSVVNGEPAGWNTGSLRHGGFSGEKVTLESLTAYLQEV